MSWRVVEMVKGMARIRKQRGEPLPGKMGREDMGQEKGAFEEFEATSLYCPRCGRAVPVRKRLLLVLIDGEIYEYICAYCSESLGSKTVKGGEQVEVLV